MDPITIAAILASPQVKSAVESLAKDALGIGKQALIRRLQPTAREKAAREAIRLFAEQWDEELEATAILDAAVDPLREQLKHLLETAAAEIALWMDPETKEVDLSLIASTWVQLKLDPLPGDFKWTRVAENYARAIKKYIKNDPDLRDAYSIALQERQTEALERIAGSDPGFDLTAYRQFLLDKKCNALQLAVMHSSTYEFGGKVTLWSVFVPQSARESAPIPEIPPELQRRLREQGHLTKPADEDDLADLRQRYQSSPVRPVLEILDRNRHVVVVGDPGSGKTSLLRYRALRWAKEDLGPLPLVVDLKEYVKGRGGIRAYCQSAHEVFGLNAAELKKRLLAGQAAFYLDGLDEIFDPSARQAVIEEIVVLSASYAQASIVVTSRKVGYEPERLRNAGFLHATLEEFDLPQMLDFLRHWHRIAEPDDKERALMLERLERALQDSPAIRELAGNPLLLTMMAILNRNQELPRYRVDLYREASRVLLNDWDARRALPVGEFDREDKEGLLRELAGEMQQAEGGLAGNLIEQSRLKEKVLEFLEGLHVPESRAKATLLMKQLAERNFILAYAGADRFSFVHRTFLEFYCAAWFVDRFQKKQDLTLEELKTEVFGRHWRDEKWHEVLRLIAGMVGEKKAEELILFLMARDGRNDKLTNLMLAAGCLNEVRNRGATKATAQALWRRFVDEAIRFSGARTTLDEDTETRQSAVRWMALAWKGEAAKVWLRSAATQDADWIVRQAAVQELARGWKDDPETLPLLKDRARNDGFSFVRQAAVQELARGWKDDPDTLPLLKDRARNDKSENVRYAAVQELARGWKDDPETLPWLQDRVRSDEDWAVRQTAVQELARGWKDDPDTLPLLQDRAQNDEDNGVRWAAVQELERGWKDDPEVAELRRSLK
jgi:predicted NACHT family NTPase